MHAFEYLSVLISIVLGLALAQLLTAVGRWLERREEVTGYWPAGLWTAFLLIAQVQTWWAMFGLRNAETWTFLQFSIVLLQPALLFLLSCLALPSPVSPALDLKAYFLSHRRWFFSLLLALLAVSVLKDRVIAGRWPSLLNLGFHAAFAVCAATALASRRGSVQLVAALVAVGVILAYVGLLFANLA
jgi:hypothetical protein